MIIKTPILSVREIQQSDIELITSYWLTAADNYLQAMGVDLNKMPAREQWINILSEQLAQPYNEKKSYCTIWLKDGKPTGHCNVNKIVFAKEAYLHLHIWDAEIRKKGFGTSFLKISIPYFFINLQLKKIYCEPYSRNASPNKTLPKLGFRFIKEHITIPGMLNFEQRVQLWELDDESFIRT